MRRASNHHLAPPTCAPGQRPGSDAEHHVQGAGRRLAPRAAARYSRSLEYGLILLESFTAERPALRVSEIAELLQITRGTAHRYASTLVQLGWLQQDHKRRYQLATAAANPGASVLGSVRREIRARSILEDLRSQTGYSVSLALLDGPDAVYVYRLAAHRAGQHHADGPQRAGTRFPAPYAPVGMALLSALTTSELLSALAEQAVHHADTPLNVQALIDEVDMVKQGGIASGPGAHGTACVIAAPAARRVDRPVIAVELIVPSGSPNAIEQFAGRVKHTARLLSE